MMALVSRPRTAFMASKPCCTCSSLMRREMYFCTEMRPEAMANLRERLREEPAQVLKILREPSFASQFVLLGDDYQRQYRPPEGMDPQLGALYVKKNVYCEHHVGDPQGLMGSGLRAKIAEGFRAMAPFYHLLRDCLRTQQDRS